MTDETLPIPVDRLGNWGLAHAYEMDQIDDHVSPPERGNDRSVEWGVRDVTDWFVAEGPTDGDDNTIRLTAITEGKYKVQTARAVTNAPPSKCHPAEYETREMQVGIEVTIDLDTPPETFVFADAHAVARPM